MKQQPHILCVTLFVFFLQNWFDSGISDGAQPELLLPMFGISHIRTFRPSYGMLSVRICLFLNEVQQMPDFSVVCMLPVVFTGVASSGCRIVPGWAVSAVGEICASTTPCQEHSTLTPVRVGGPIKTLPNNNINVFKANRCQQQQGRRDASGRVLMSDSLSRRLAGPPIR